MSENATTVAGGLVAGLSIDDGVLRVVVLDRQVDPIVVEAAEADLAEDVVRAGQVLDQPALARRIGDLWLALGLGGVPTFLGLHPLDGDVHTVPIVGQWRSGWPLEVRQAVEAARQAIGDEVVWSADRVEHGDTTQARVVTCRRDDLSSAAWSARRSGVWVTGVELGALALERAVEPSTDPASLLVDATGPGAATIVQFDYGVAVHSWRSHRAVASDENGPLVRFAIDAATATALSAGALSPVQWLSSSPRVVAHPARLVGPGHGLGPSSPVPHESFAVALGLALGAAGVGVTPIDLQAALLNTGAAQLHARLGDRARTLGAELAAAVGAGPERGASGEQARIAAVGSGDAAAETGPSPFMARLGEVAAAPPPPAEPGACANLDPDVVVAGPEPEPEPEEFAVAGRPPAAEPPEVEPSPVPATARRTLSVEAFLGGAGPMVLPPVPRRAHVGAGEIAEAAVAAVPVSGPPPAAEQPEPVAMRPSVGLFPAPSAAPRVESEQAAEPVHDESEQAAEPVPVEPESEPAPMVLRHARRTRTVAVVAGAAAVGSFFAARAVGDAPVSRPAPGRETEPTTTTSTTERERLPLGTATTERRPGTDTTSTSGTTGR